MPDWVVKSKYGILNSAYFKDFIEESTWKFRRFFFCGKRIYEDSNSEGKQVEYVYSQHSLAHFFSIKLISPGIAVYKQTVFPISLNCPTIPYKNFGG